MIRNRFMPYQPKHRIPIDSCGIRASLNADCVDISALLLAELFTVAQRGMHAIRSLCEQDVPHRKKNFLWFESGSVRGYPLSEK
jgi:hypothetical protein